MEIPPSSAGPASDFCADIAPQYAPWKATASAHFGPGYTLSMSQPSQSSDMLPAEGDSFVLRHRKAILFLTAALCVAGGYAAYTMPAAVFPQTDFPRVVILIDNGVMPADEMMATITRPVEEAMKNIPGTVNIRSTTGRGSAAVDVFFDWSTDMVESELYVLGRLAQIRSSLPSSAEFAVHRLTFSAFPIIGISLTSKSKDITELWEMARYDLSPRLLRIRGVGQVKLVGGRVPEYHVVVDPVKLHAHQLSLWKHACHSTSSRGCRPAPRCRTGSVGLSSVAGALAAGRQRIRGAGPGRPPRP